MYMVASVSAEMGRGCGRGKGKTTKNKKRKDLGSKEKLEGNHSICLDVLLRGKEKSSYSM